MAENTAISWTDHTFNPWWGCAKVSPACDHCYAERDAKRFAAGQVLWGVDSARRTFGDKHWKAPRDWNAKAANLRAFGFLDHRPRVFCASMGDWLDLDAPLDQFVRLLDTVMRTPELDWLLLSKRIGNWRKRLDEASATIADRVLFGWVRAWLNGDPPANVVLMATIIDQGEYDRDIGKLLRTPARIHGLSIEPMLGPIDMRIGGASMPDYAPHRPLPRLGWVICGGESGPKARPMHPNWPRSLRDQCAAAGVPFHFKQHGEWMPIERDGDTIRLTFPLGRPMGPKQPQFDDVTGTARVGKAAAGRLLDGVEHNGFPA